MLVDPRIKTGKSIMKIIFDRKKRTLHPLYVLMNKIEKSHQLTIPQVAIAYCSNKGVVPICGCRRLQQVKELSQAVNTILTEEEIEDGMDSVEAEVQSQLEHFGINEKI